MDISSAYKLVKQSIVAFTAKYVPLFKEGAAPPPFPPILGTGFAIREDGLIATNAHVVKAFGRVPRPDDVPPEEWAVRALLLKLTPQGMLEIPLEIQGVASASASRWHRWSAWGASSASSRPSSPSSSWLAGPMTRSGRTGKR